MFTADVALVYIYSGDCAVKLFYILLEKIVGEIYANHGR
jgi:hypothetical protein